MTAERIAELRQEQDRLRTFASKVDAPALLFLADDDSVSIHGNEAGLIRLALEVLDVSAGGQVSPAAYEWIDAAGLPLESIRLDPNPKLEAPKVTLRSRLLGYGIMVAVLGIWLVGMIVGIQWLLQRFHH